MSLTILKHKDLVLPNPETIEGLTAENIMDKIRSFYYRLEKSNNWDLAEYAEGYFLELMFNYPKSMCSRNMTETLKQLIALIYFESKPEPEEKEPVWNGFSYEDLSIIFDLSKATVHEAIKQKEHEAKQLLEEVKLKAKAKTIALEELVKEEKMRLLEEKNKGIEETNEQTPSSLEREDI